VTALTVTQRRRLRDCCSIKPAIKLIFNLLEDVSVDLTRKFFASKIALPVI
jgi:hypothetical protein